ncbi:MAG: elongation factor G [bacterium]
MPRQYPIEKIRNIGIIAHIDAGKTTVTERILYYTGKTHKIGEVHTGDTQMDWMEQERERGITITSAATTCIWKEHQINIIDTPGHIDFTAEVQRSLRVLDAAIVVFDGKMGVEPQSETVWHQADNFKVPRICLINKVNLLGGDFYRSLESIHERLTDKAFPIFLPIGFGEELKGIVDLIEQKAYEYETEDVMNFKETEIPEDMKELVLKYRQEMIEKIVEIDDVLTEKFLDNKKISNQEIKQALRKGVCQGVFFPVLGGDGRKAVTKILLDCIVEYLPEPSGQDAKPFSALAFKVATDPYVGQLTYFRVYDGILNAGETLLNSTQKKRIRIGRIVRMHADHREEVKEVYAGGIAAAVGVKDLTTGDTICDPAHPVILEKIQFPEPVISIAVEPKTKADQEKLAMALNRLAQEDPTFKIKGDPETGQTLISGMGELHLEIIVDRMRREFNVSANVGKPRVAYKETVTQIAEAEGKYIRQSGGRGQYGHVWLKVEPSEKYEFVNAIKGGAIPQEFIPAVKKGVKEAVDKGIIAGYPVVDVKATLYDGSFHQVDSSEAAFKIAASIAFQAAAKRAKPVLLEPIMKIEVVAPPQFLGDVTGDLAAKRAHIENIEDRANIKVIDAKVPLASMFGYATQIRSISQGRASFTMEFSHYAQVPANIAEEIIGGKKA